MAELTKREAATELRRRDRLKLAELRHAIKVAKAARPARAALVRAHCRAARDRITATARQRREALRDVITGERAAARSSCALDREEVVTSTAKLVGASKAETAKLRAQAKRERAELLGSKLRQGAGGRKAAEVRGESDDAVINEFDERFRPVWEKVKHTIKATPRASRAEVFAHWMHENSGQVAEILHAKEAKDERELIAAEKRLARDMAKGDRYRGCTTCVASQTDPDEWGG